MTSLLTEYPVDADFTRESLHRLSWAAPYFTETLHSFRWAGLSGLVLDRGDVSTIGFMPVLASDEKEASGFAILAVRKGDPALPSLFAVPLGMSIEPSGDPSPALSRGTGARFQFKNGVSVLARILIDDVAFWKKLGWAILGQSITYEGLLIDMLDPGFSSGMRTASTLPAGDAAELAFLGGGDTTNIVIKFKVPSSPGLDFVLKFYPRIAFNTARFLNDMLASAKFHHFARLVAACDYKMETVSRFFHDSMLGAFFDQVEVACSSLNVPVNRFFPFIHLIQYIPGNGDGGMPFWNSAASPHQSGADLPGQDVVGLAFKLGKTVAEFHQALREKGVRPGDDMHAQLHKQIQKVTAQFNSVKAHLSTYQQSLPGELSEMFSGLLQMLDLEVITRKVVPDGTEYQEAKLQYIHQDLHMGQLMFIDALGEFSILDLEGDPQLPWKERLGCSPVERDLASLVRSLSYIKIAALRKRIETELKDVGENVPRFTELYPLLFLTPSNLVDCLYSRVPPATKDAIAGLVKTLNAWERNLQGFIIGAYAEERPIREKILLYFKLQRILNEITYEIKFRPTNVFVPCMGLLELVGT
ncbi:MAG: hypothetical protein JW839_03755 [Candidatus Lokiarchaeota archaeon]|nr:hypothetical protein [Candidatus Lokiarchaeota archaeon]